MIGERADAIDQRVVSVHQQQRKIGFFGALDEIVPVALQLPVERPPVGRGVAFRAGRGCFRSLGRQGLVGSGLGGRGGDPGCDSIGCDGLDDLRFFARCVLALRVRALRVLALRPAAPGGRPWPLPTADTCRRARAVCGTPRFRPGRSRRARPAGARTPADGGGRMRPASSARRAGRGSRGRPGSAPPRRPRCGVRSAKLVPGLHDLGALGREGVHGGAVAPAVDA